MKKLLLILLVFIVSSSPVWTQTTSKTSVVKPTNYQKRVTTVIAGKNRNYYSLHHEKASVINVEGPGKLQVITRGRIKPGSSGKINYTIRYTIDGGEQKTFVVTGAVRSENDTYLDGNLGIPAQSKEFIITLGRGDHTIEFFLQDDQTPVAARYKFIPLKPKKQDWIAYSPLRPSEPVDLITKETTVGYYRFSNKKPLFIEINGPTELRVLTRIENHYHMKGIIHYRIQVKENNAVIKTFRHTSERSDITSYSDNKELVPGKACEFVLDVPKGKHTYEIYLLDEDKNTVLGRLLIPKKDVKLVK